MDRLCYLFTVIDLGKVTIPKKLLDIIKSIKNRRARIVIDHVLKHGFITTEDLEKKYGYSHPPRAARDVRESGIPLETYNVKSSEGRSIAAYRFGDLSQIKKDQLSGRSVIPKQFKDQLYEKSGDKCAICSGTFEIRYFQADHRIPYLVAGDKSGSEKLESYMLLCGSCNRAKSWSCEHCPNGLQYKKSDICSKCYWANPTNYSHVAMRQIRRMDIVWSEDEVKLFDRVKQLATIQTSPLPDYVKKVLVKHVKELDVKE
jgi:hypothetical protein